MKPWLPEVTLMCVDCVKLQRAINTIEWCKNLCDFGAVKLLTHFETGYEHKVEIPQLTDLTMYSIFMLTDIYKYIDTSHVLIVQADGFIINPNSWDPAWLKYDYVAPLFVQYLIVGSGGFSLRSKEIMKYAAFTLPEWDRTKEGSERVHLKAGCYEDGFLSMQLKGFKIAPKEEACKFAQAGNPNQNYYHEYPFGFHGTRQNVDVRSGKVDRICVHGGEYCECVKEITNYLTLNNI